LLKDTKKLGGGINLIYSEHGNFEQHNEIKCESYSTELCLHGDHILYTNAEFDLGQGVSICNEMVTVQKAFEFRLEVSGNKKDTLCTKHWAVDPSKVIKSIESGSYEEKSNLHFDEGNLAVPSSGIRIAFF